MTWNKRNYARRTINKIKKNFKNKVSAKGFRFIDLNEYGKHSRHESQTLSTPTKLWILIKKNTDTLIAQTKNKTTKVFKI